jgi:hypothetical protein
VGQVAVLGGRWLLEPLALLMLAVALASTARITALAATVRADAVPAHTVPAHTVPAHTVPAHTRRPRRAGLVGAAVIDDTALALMAVATAGMLVPGLRTLPDSAWEVVFAVLTTWFAIRSARAARRAITRSASARALAAPNCAPHLVHCAAMLYTFLALPAAPGAGRAGPGGMTMTGMASVAGVLRPAASGPSALYHVLAVAGALVVVGYCVRDVGHLSSRPYRVPGAVAAPAALLLSQASRVGCRAVMGVTMAVMLVIMT